MMAMTLTRKTPLKAPDVLARVRIEQQLVWVEAMALLGGIRTMGPQPIDQTRAGFGQVSVKDVASATRQGVPCEFALTQGIEEAPFDALGMV